MKKFLAILIPLIIVVAVGGYFGSQYFMGSKPAHEQLQSIIKSYEDVESFHADVNGTMSMKATGDNIPADVDYMLSMFNNIKLKVSADYIMKPDLFKAKLYEEVDMSGFVVKLSAYIDQQKMIVDYPIIAKQILIEYDELKERFGISIPENFWTDYVEIFTDSKDEFEEVLFSYLSEDNVYYGETRTFSDGEKEQELNTIVIDLDIDTFIDLYIDYAQVLLESDKAHELVRNLIKENLDVLELTDSDLDDFDTYYEELKTMVSEFKDPDNEYRQELTQALAEIDADSDIKVTVGIDKWRKPVVSWVDFNFDINDPDTDSTISLKYSIEYKISQVNKLDDIEAPDLDDDDVFTLDELEEMFGGY